MSKPAYKPEEGTEGYVHVRVTEKQGQALDKPVIEQYHPNAWAGVAKLPGFKGEVVHDPRSAAQKTAAALTTRQVKSTEKLETPEQYRDRYKELFKEEAPFNMSADELKLTVDRANNKLAELQGGEKAVSEEQAVNQTNADGQNTNPDNGHEGEQDDTEKLPTSKKGWFAEFQKAFPDDTTEYEEITEKEIRARLGK